MAKAQKLPYMQFYPADLDAEPTLRLCSWEACWLWIKLLGFMHHSPERGFLLKANGKPYTEDELVLTIAGATIDKIRNALFELETNAVYSRDRRGFIYNRKMVKGEKRAKNLGKKKTKNEDNSEINSRKNEDKSDLDIAESNGNEKTISTSDDRSLVIPETRDQRPIQKEDNKLSYKKRGVRLPDDWELQRPLGEWAMQQGLTRDQVIREADKFKNFWHSKTGKDATKMDWDKTFKNWIYNSTERKSNHAERPLSRSERLDIAQARALEKLNAITGPDEQQELPTLGIAPPVV